MAPYMPQVAMYGNYVPHNNLFAMGGLPLTQNYTLPIAGSVEGKGKSREADFDAAFAQAAAFLPSQEAGTSGIVEVNDGVTDIEEALKSTTLKDHTIEPDFRR